ncbi:MAG: nuclear transport factor 2 family protein [Actinobacteria bacterium]|nr:nuclear transport factor 2 family protein [Actinomycetota bacterium]
MSEATDVARRLFAAIEAGDVDAVKALYHPDAEIWHNTDGVTKSFDHTMQVVEWMIANMPGVRYTDVHLSPTDDGFVSRHVVATTRADGVEATLPCSLVATVRDGQLFRLYEYFDSAAQARFGPPM